jgi:hypothetical protein
MKVHFERHFCGVPGHLAACQALWELWESVEPSNVRLANRNAQIFVAHQSNQANSPDTKHLWDRMKENRS